MRVQLLFLFCFCFFFCFAEYPLLAKKKTKPSYSFSSPMSVFSGHWSASKNRYLFHVDAGKTGKIWQVEPQLSKSTLLSEGVHSFYPSFGPFGTILSGEKQTCPYSLTTPQSLQKFWKQHPVAQLRKKSSILFRGSEGVVMQKGKEKERLFRGYQPLYSFESHKMLFQFCGLLFLWNPQKTPQKGVSLLVKAVQGRWSPTGLAMTFQSSAWNPTQQKKGGVWIMDMLFRGAPVSEEGGNPFWSNDGKTLYYQLFVKKEKQVHLMKMTLVKNKKTIGVVQKNVLSASISFDDKYLAYENQQGIWIQHRITRKTRLLSSSGHKPLFSKENWIAIHHKNRIDFYKPSDWSF